MPEYLKVIKKQWLVIVITIIVVWLASFIYTQRQPISYEGSTTLWITPVSSIGQKEVPYYEYDSYYSIQAGQLYALTVTSWLKSPDVIAEIYKKAGVDFTIGKMKEATQSLQATFATGSLTNMAVNVKITHSNQAELSKLIDATTSVTQNKTQEYNTQAQQKITFNVVGGLPFIIENKPSSILNSLIGILAGLVLGIFFAYFKEYFFKKETE